MNKNCLYNHELHKMIYESGLKKNFLAVKLGITPQRLSMIISGNKLPTKQEKNCISKILKTNEKDIFS